MTKNQIDKHARENGIRSHSRQANAFSRISPAEIQYEVQAVAELESLILPRPGAAACSSRDAPASVMDNVQEARGLEKTPRNVQEIVTALCNEESWVLTPLGQDMDTMQLGRQLKGGECLRRLFCLRFDVEYTPMPLGTKQAWNSIVNKCNRDLATPAQLPGWTADQLAERLQRENDQHIWPQQLLMRRARYVSKVDWKKLAEKFALFLQAAMLKSLQLQQVMKRMQVGQLCVLAIWWGLFKYNKGIIGRPSTLTTVFLEKDRYTPMDAVVAPEIPYFTTVRLMGRPELSAPRVCQLCGEGFKNWESLIGHCSREHASFNEYRKRIFWEAEKCDALGLPN